ncbi:MAG TPA: AraC family transcriptional regulator [Planctomycetota bacterium]|nr:AraC family transcriptional regulator [Planctomycetota bacterium]
MQPLAFFWRRADLPPLTRQPLVVRSVAHAVAPPHWQEDQRRRGYVKLQWTISGGAEIRHDGEARLVGPGDVTLFTPGREHWARAAGGGWSCWWFTLGERCAAWPVLEACGLDEAGTWAGGPCPQPLFRALSRAVAMGTADGEERAGALAYQLLARVARVRRTRDVVGAMAAAFAEIERRWADPDFGIAALATVLGTHRSVLSRGFARIAGVPPSAYLLRLRLERAAALLHASRLDVARVATRCGFAEASYFARAFRRAYGRSPSEHRRAPGP